MPLIPVLWHWPQKPQKRQLSIQLWTFNRNPSKLHWWKEIMIGKGFCSDRLSSSTKLVHPAEVWITSTYHPLQKYTWMTAKPKTSSVFHVLGSCLSTGRPHERKVMFMHELKKKKKKKKKLNTSRPSDEIQLHFVRVNRKLACVTSKVLFTQSNCRITQEKKHVPWTLSPHLYNLCHGLICSLKYL